MGLFDFLKPSEGRLSSAERREYRDHLAELDVYLEEGLEHLGADITSMTERGQIDGKAIWQQAARLSAIEDEITLVERGISERLTRTQLAELARDQARERTDDTGDESTLP